MELNCKTFDAKEFEGVALEMLRELRERLQMLDICAAGNRSTEKEREEQDENKAPREAGSSVSVGSWEVSPTVNSMLCKPPVERRDDPRDMKPSFRDQEGRDREGRGEDVGRTRDSVECDKVELKEVAYWAQEACSEPENMDMSKKESRERGPHCMHRERKVCAQTSGYEESMSERGERGREKGCAGSEGRELGERVRAEVCGE